MSEMQEAGYILLMPGGDWNADTTYHILHLVNHNGASWLCKVEECTGQEPSDSNTEFWQRFGTAVDLSNYLQKSGGIVSGNLEAMVLEEVDVYTGVRNKKRRVYQHVNGTSGIFRLYDWTNDRAIIESLLDGTNTFNGTASGNLSLSSGGTVKTANRRAMSVSNTGGSDVSIGYRYGDTLLGEIGVNGNGAYYIDSSNIVNTLLHSSNKPTGSYTGNGDATERVFDIGGFGGMCIVCDNTTGAYFNIVTYCGGVTVSSTEINSKTRAQMKFENGILTIASDSTAINGSGKRYQYWVI